MTVPASATPFRRKLARIVALAAVMLLLNSYFPVDLTHAQPSTTIMITEIMYDPAGSDSGHEWIEVLNVSMDPVDLNGWTIQTAGTSFTTRTTLGSYIVNPGEYIVIGDPLVEEADITIPSLSLQNADSDTDGVRIRNSSLATVDTVLYGTPNSNLLIDDAGQKPDVTAPDVSSGSSLARKHAVDSDNSAIDFIEASIPTPGEQNAFIPIATISCPPTAYVNTPVSCHSNLSFDPDSIIVIWSWRSTLNGTITDESNSPDFTFTPSEEGTYAIELTITDDDFLAGTTAGTIEVQIDPLHPPLTEVQNIAGMQLESDVFILAAITSLPGIPSDSEAYAQDPTGGIRLRLPQATDVQFGKTYIIGGTIDTVYGEARMLVDNVLESDAPIVILPLHVPLNSIGQFHAGMLISTEMLVSETNNRYFYSDDEATGITVSVYIPETLELDTPGDIKGTILTVTGILSRYGTNSDGTPRMRIIPRFPDEWSITGLPPEAAGASNEPPNTFDTITSTTLTKSGIGILPTFIAASFCTLLVIRKTLSR